MYHWNEWNLRNYPTIEIKNIYWNRCWTRLKKIVEEIVRSKEREEEMHGLVGERVKAAREGWNLARKSSRSFSSFSLSSPLLPFFPPRSLSSRARASSSFLLDRIIERYWIENCTKKFFSGLRWISWKTLKTEIFSLLFYLDSGRGEWEEGSRRGRGRKWRSKRAERE